ncbi:DNA-binding protein [Viridibacillus soli]|uniref:DNA-binding protein n=1 Tax=Viridibacillus soli TaxID=2798301 RepID=UPI001F3838D2|nr:DNA-binding protein [Viridibacillus soli]
MKKFLLRSIVTFLALFAFMANVDISFAENSSDPAPILVPTTPNGKKVLFDNSHGQTAGQADWVINGAFSDFANALVAEDYYVKEHRSANPLTLQDLQGYDVFVIPEAQIPFKQSEQEAIATFAKQGGGVFFIADHYNADRNLNRWDSNEVMNGWRRGAFNNPTKGMSQSEIAAMTGVESSDWLSDEFGVRFRFNAVDNTEANMIVPAAESFGITTGINAISIHAGSTLAITKPSLAKGIVYLPNGLTSAANKWNSAVDQGVYFGGGINEGPFVAIGKKELGKSAFIGDSSPVEDNTPKYLNEENGGAKRTYSGFTEKDNGKLLVKVVKWLAQKETYTDFTTSAITLDQASPILPLETTELSTETQAEPWRAPATNYKWYDPSTFKQGSYGASTNTPPIPSDQYSVNTPSTLPLEGIPFPVEIVLNQLTPYSQVTNAQIQVYLSGGQSISQVQASDGTWPTSYGYGNVGTLTADSNGQIRKTIMMRLNPTITAQEATIRLRLGSGNNVVTQSVALSALTDPYVVLAPKSLPKNGYSFPIQVVLNGLTPHSQVTNGQIQVYIEGGQSISQVQSPDGTWPTNYGYSDVGTLTANENGRAMKTIYLRLNPSVTNTSANLRLRLGSGNNVLTNTVELH